MNHDERLHYTDAIIGWPVFTRDGEKLGTVKEVGNALFKVDAPMQPDYWLQSEFVETNTDQKVVMTFEKANVGDYKVKHPEEGAVIMEAASMNLPQTEAAATIEAADDRKRG